MLDTSIYVYQVKTFFKDILLTNIVKLCYETEITELFENPIAFSEKERRDLDNFNIYKSSVKEAVRENHTNMLTDEYRVKEIDILDGKFNENEDLILCRLDIGTENLYTLCENIPLPTSIHFDYLNNVDNAHYDLNQVLNILLNREDIDIIPDKYCHTYLIQEIPYYNVSEGCNKFIDFIWHPTDEDWIKYFNSGYFERYNRYNYILNEILGLKMCVQPMVKYRK